MADSLSDLIRQYIAIERERLGLPPHRWPSSPFDPRHYYDYIKALQSMNRGDASLGVDPASMELHWPDEFKEFGHPAYSSKWFSPTRENPEYIPPQRPPVDARDDAEDVLYNLVDAFMGYMGGR